MKELYDTVRNIRDVVSDLVIWASGAGLGYNVGGELMNKLYSTSLVFIGNEDREDE